MRASNKRNYSKLGKQIKKKLIDNDMKDKVRTVKSLYGIQ